MLVSAWVPYSDTITPAKTVAELRAAGISTAVLMVNDYSTARGPAPFRTFDRAKLVDMAAACRDAELVVWLCSWVMPHAEFITGSIDQLPSLLTDTGADLLMWDAEGPWTDSAEAALPTAAASRLARAFGMANMGVTAIGSAPPEVKPLAEVCSVWVPQCYATRDSQSTPGGVVPYSLSAWRKRYGHPGHWVIGLAAYDQADDPAKTMQPPVDDLLAAEISEVCYWTSNAIASRPDVLEFVASLTRAAPPHPGIMPTVDIAAMPSATRVQIVATIQGLLMARRIDPGPLDGKPGAKTLAGVKAFQQRKMLAPTGVVDASTWSELLRP